MGFYCLVFSDCFMNRIETLYQASITSMSPREKVAKSIGLFNWSRDFISREVRKSNPDVSLERLKLLVALRMYRSELKIRKTIEGLLANVPD